MQTPDAQDSDVYTQPDVDTQSEVDTQIDTSQQALAQSILDVIEDVKELQPIVPKSSADARYEVLEFELEGRPVYWVHAGKNCNFEIDKNILEELQAGTFSGAVDEEDDPFSKQAIILDLECHIGMAKNNIKDTRRYDLPE